MPDPSTQGRIANPDLKGILDGNPRATHDAVVLLLASVNLALQHASRRRLFWQDVPYASGLFGASAGTWTVASGDFTFYRYLMADRLLLCSFLLQTTTTSAGIGSELYLGLPMNLSASAGTFTGALLVQATADEVGIISTRAAGNETSLSLQRLDGSAWPVETDTLNLRGSIALEIG